jgi:hypothetical protein
MATDPRCKTARGNGHAHRAREDLAVAEDHQDWVARSQVMLTPIAAPSIMGWFGALTLVTFWCAIGALAQNLLVFVTLAALTAASVVTAAGFWAGRLGTVNADGWLFAVSAAAAWLADGAMVLEHPLGRSITPVGKWSKTANVPGSGSPTPSPTRPTYPASRSASNFAFQQHACRPRTRGRPAGSTGGAS